MTDDIIFIPFLEICPFVRVWVRAQPRSKTSLVLLGLRVKYFLRKWDRKIQASFIKCLFSVLQTYSPVTSILFFFLKGLNLMDTVEETEPPWFLGSHNVWPIKKSWQEIRGRDGKGKVLCPLDLSLGCCSGCFSMKCPCSSKDDPPYRTVHPHAGYHLSPVSGLEVVKALQLLVSWFSSIPYNFLMNVTMLLPEGTMYDLLVLI